MSLIFSKSIVSKKKISNTIIVSNSLDPNCLQKLSADGTSRQRVKFEYVLPGRFVNITSVKGRLAVSLDSAYGMIKYAGEAFSDILRREMGRFGVKVAIIEPGDYGGLTGMGSEVAVRFKMYSYHYADTHLRIKIDCSHSMETPNLENILPFSTRYSHKERIRSLWGQIISL